MAEPDRDTVDEYRRYQDRFEKELGPCETGTYLKHRSGRLIRKLTYQEFENHWRELVDVNRAYAEIVANGDTINDVLVKVLRERSDELLLERPI